MSLGLPLDNPVTGIDLVLSNPFHNISFLEITLGFLVGFSFSAYRIKIPQEFKKKINSSISFLHRYKLILHCLASMKISLQKHQLVNNQAQGICWRWVLWMNNMLKTVFQKEKRNCKGQYNSWHWHSISSFCLTMQISKCNREIKTGFMLWDLKVKPRMILSQNSEVI